MMVTEQTDLERDQLTDEEVGTEFPKFAPYTKCLVKFWYRRCKRLIDPDQLESDINLQILRSLRSYRRRNGTTIKNWVDHGMDLMARKSISRQAQMITKRREIQMYTASRDQRKNFAIKSLPASYDDLNGVGVRQAADQILTLLHNQMDERRWSLFHQRFIQDRFLHEIAADLGVSKASVHKSTQTALKHAREIVSSRPEFARYAIYAN